jgi:hypothetical protein
LPFVWFICNSKIDFSLSLNFFYFGVNLSNEKNALDPSTHNSWLSRGKKIRSMSPQTTFFLNFTIIWYLQYFKCGLLYKSKIRWKKTLHIFKALFNTTFVGISLIFICLSIKELCSFFSIRMMQFPKFEFKIIREITNEQE